MPETRSGLTPALLIPKSSGSEGESVPCMFNPYEYSISKSNQYDPGKTKGLNIPRIRFQQGGAMVLKLNLVFDTYAQNSDVTTEHTKKLWKMMMIDRNNINATTGKAEPPHCVFRWGRYEFEGVRCPCSRSWTQRVSPRRTLPREVVWPPRRAPSTPETAST